MFDRYVEERRKSQWDRRSLIGASIFGHITVGLFLFAVTLFTVDEIRPPALAIVFLKAPPPPPPLPPAFGVKHETPRPQPVKPKPKPKVERVIVQPVEKPPEAKPAPPEEPDDEEEGDPEGVTGGSKEGVQGGVKEGVEGGMLGPTGPVGPQTAPALPPKPKMVAAFVFDRERVKYPDPHLPDAFKQSHAQQTVKGMYRICVDTDGNIYKMETVTSLSGADESIMQQVRSTWQYKPQPVPVCTIRVFEFHIN
jgi:hypothetical protein